MTPASQAYKSDLEREGKARAKDPFCPFSRAHLGEQPGLQGWPAPEGPTRAESLSFSVFLFLSLFLFARFALLCSGLGKQAGPGVRSSERPIHHLGWTPKPLTLLPGLMGKNPAPIIAPPLLCWVGHTNLSISTPSANSSWHHASISFSQPGHRARSVPRKGNGALEPTWLLSLFYFSLSLFCDGKAKTVNAKLTLFAEKVLRALETRHC